MRDLVEPPSELMLSGEPRFGSVRGGLPRMDFGAIPRGRLWQMTHRKRWSYAAVADASVLVGAAIVSLGYAATALFFVLDRKARRMLVDRSVLGPGTAARFTDDGSGRRSARFELGRTRFAIGDDGVTIDLAGDLPAHVLLRTKDVGATPIAAVVPIEGGFANATEKRLLAGECEVVAGGKRFVLDDATCALDHTHGYLARHTAWRWALGMGRAVSGERVAFNVVEGFVGEPECGFWIDGELFACEEGSFDYDAEHPERPWTLRTRCGSLDLRFSPAAVHREEKDMFVIRSSFVQPAGDFEGTIRAGDRVLSVAALPGVTEHQDVLW